MIDDMQFSVVIPLYNKAAHVARAIESVFAQHFKGYEIIVINDASTDESALVATSLLDGKDRCRILHRDSPGRGGYAARNLGAREAHYPWLAFLDADDEWTPDHLGDLKRLIDSGISSEFLCTGVIEILPSGKPWSNAYLRGINNNGLGVLTLNQYADMASRGRNPIFTSACAVSRDFFLDQGGFPEGTFGRGGDRELWVRLLSVTTLGWIANESAYYHRDADNMVTKTVKFDLELCMDATVRSLVTENRAHGNVRLAKSLMKMLNFERKRPIRRKIEAGELRPSDVRKLYFSVDPLYSISVFVASLLPIPFLNLLLTLKRKYLRRTI